MEPTAPLMISDLPLVSTPIGFFPCAITRCASMLNKTLANIWFDILDFIFKVNPQRVEVFDLRYGYYSLTFSFFIIR